MNTTCKDCIHYPVCADRNPGMVDVFGEDSTLEPDGLCKTFKDKSRFIELPCAVGDTVYKVWYTACHNGETYPDSYICCGCEDECDMGKTIFEIVVPNIRFICEHFVFEKNSSVYFLTKEDAEKALKGGAE